MTEGPADRPYFFDDGIRFTCTHCGNCCTGGPGLVRVSLPEQESLATFLEMDADTFNRRFVRSVEGEHALRERENGECIFFVEGRCSVYEARPSQCRTYPFWFKNLRSEEAWSKTCEACPGIGQGRLFGREEILGFLA